MTFLHPSFAANDSGVSSNSAFSLHPLLAHQLFGAELPKLLDELNTVLAA